MLYTGLDLHKGFSYITTMNNKGEIVGHKKLPNNGEVLDFLKEFDQPMEVAIEATPCWYWLYDRLEDEGFEVKLSHPLRTKAIAHAKVKTDKVDSATLAHLLRSDLLPLSYVPAKPVRLNRELLRYRASLVKIQTGIKNKIHIILAKNNINHDYSDLFGKAGMAFLHSISLSENYRTALEGYLSVLSIIRQEIKIVSKRVQQLAKEDQDSMLLMIIIRFGLPFVYYFTINRESLLPSTIASQLDGSLPKDSLSLVCVLFFGSHFETPRPLLCPSAGQLFRGTVILFTLSFSKHS